jgi:hypothetical protein
MNFRKKSTRVLIITIISTISLILLRKYTNENTPITIPVPQKIIIYNSCKTKIIDSKDKNFNKILRLTSERLKLTEKMTISSKDQASLLQQVNMCKNAWRCIEFIYDNSTSLNLDNSTEKEFKFKKLFFLISAEENLDFGTDMIYGEENYTSILDNINYDEKIMIKLLRIVENEIPYS